MKKSTEDVLLDSAKKLYSEIIRSKEIIIRFGEKLISGCRINSFRGKVNFVFSFDPKDAINIDEALVPAIYNYTKPSRKALSLVFPALLVLAFFIACSMYIGYENTVPITVILLTLAFIFQLLFSKRRRSNHKLLEVHVRLCNKSNQYMSMYNFITSIVKEAIKICRKAYGINNIRGYVIIKHSAYRYVYALKENLHEVILVKAY